MSETGPRIIAFPRDGIAYVDCFYAAAEARGAEVIRGEWAGGWINSNVRRGDVAHIHWPSFYYAVRGWDGVRSTIEFTAFVLLMRLRGARIVWTAHNLYPHSEGRPSRVHRFIRKLVVWLSEFVLVHGGEAERIVRREFSVAPMKLCRILHGHWIDYYPRDVGTPEARGRLGITPETFVFGFVGMCKPYKNLDGLIDAFSKCRGDATLLIAGSFSSDAYRQHIERLLAKLDPARVIFKPGFIADADLQVYVRAASVLVNPFTDILTSGSAMLALSFGRPVVAPKLGSMPEVITAPCGVLYDPADPNGLTRAMEAARTRGFDETQITDYAASFSWDKAVDPFLDALKGR